MKPIDTFEQFKRFHRHARELQAKYKESIRLLVGMETEWIHGGTADEFAKLMAEFPLDYIVGSVHHVCGVPIDFDQSTFERIVKMLSNGSPDSEDGVEKAFSEYFDAQYQMLTAFKPTVVGHFDLIRLFRPLYALSVPVWTKIRRNIEWIVANGSLVEINTRSWKKGWSDAYPQRDIIKVTHPFASNHLFFY